MVEQRSLDARVSSDVPADARDGPNPGNLGTRSKAVERQESTG